MLSAAAKSLQSCSTLCDPIDSSPPDSCVPVILQTRILEWVAIFFSNAWKWKVREVAQSCPTLSDPMDCSPQGSSVHGIFQARVLECGAIAFSGNSTLKWLVTSLTQLNRRGSSWWILSMGHPLEMVLKVRCESTFHCYEFYEQQNEVDSALSLGIK